MVKVTREQACAAGKEAGNRSMTKAGRLAWSMEDLRAAAIQFDRLTGALPPAKRKTAKIENRGTRRASDSGAAPGQPRPDLGDRRVRA